jgi:hypothetical protein
LKGVYNQKYNEKYCGFVSGIKWNLSLIFSRFCSVFSICRKEKVILVCLDSFVILNKN